MAGNHKYMQLISDNKTMMEWALYYRNLGWSPFPVGNDKKPLVKWELYQREIPSEEQIKQWWTYNPNAAIGIATGNVSGIVVVDVEAGGKINDLPKTIISRTGGRGYHYFYKYPGRLVKNAVRLKPLTDIRGDGGYVVVPPSMHKSGNRYEWNVSPEATVLAEMPSWVCDSALSKPFQTDWQKFLTSDVMEGSRNVSAAQLSGKLLFHLPTDIWDLSGWTMLKEWNATKNRPPLNEKELRDTWNSIKQKEIVRRYDNEDDKNKPQADLILELIDDNSKEIILFHDELQDPYVQLPIGNHFEVWSCKNKMFKRWLSKVFWETHQKAPNANALNAALQVIEGRAVFDGLKYVLHNRVAFDENIIWYDLSDKNWRAIKITNQGWEIVLKSPILFKRYSHQQPQVEPVHDGDPKLLFKYVNVTDMHQQILLLVWLISCFIPGFPHPIPVIYGPQGSAKSGLSKFLRKLVDPSSIEASSFPRDEEGMAQLLSHHWCIFFDNISNLPNEVSDLLCKAVTGDGFAKRELYTDDGVVIYTFKRCIGLNGINLAAKKPDLLERSILFELNRMPVEDRKEEALLLEDFEKDRPIILGGILDVISKAMQIRPSVKVPLLPRMADFAIWGCAIAEALGYSQEDFLSAYRDNIHSQNDEVLSESLVATAIQYFIADQGDWNGSPSTLLKLLTEVAVEQGINTDKELGWPKAANTLTKRLNELKTNLAEEGILVKYGKGKTRTIYLSKIGSAKVIISETSGSDYLHEESQPTLDESLAEIDF